MQNREPILIGLGFDCQKTEEIKTEKWDVKLTCVISESGILCQTEKIKNYRLIMMDQNEKKLNVAKAAVKHIHNDCLLGMGTC